MAIPHSFVPRGLLVLVCAAGLGCTDVRDRCSTTPAEKARACELLTELMRTAKLAAEKDASACCSHEWGASVEVKKDLEEKASELRRERLLKGAFRKRLYGAEKEKFADKLRGRCGLVAESFVAEPVQCTEAVVAKCEEKAKSDKAAKAEADRAKAEADRAISAAPVEAEKPPEAAPADPPAVPLTPGSPNPAAKRRPTRK